MSLTPRRLRRRWVAIVDGKPRGAFPTVAEAWARMKSLQPPGGRGEQQPDAGGRFPIRDGASRRGKVYTRESRRLDALRRRRHLRRMWAGMRDEGRLPSKTWLECIKQAQRAR